MGNYDGHVTCIVGCLEQIMADESSLWEKVLNILIENDEVESISIYVPRSESYEESDDEDNDIAEFIALNMCDKVHLAYHQYYQGRGKYTLIYHKCPLKIRNLKY